MVCMAMPLAAQSPVSDHSGPLRTLSGIVTDAPTGDPLPGAAIRIADAGAATDGDGRFRLRGLAPDTATVVITYIGYQTARRAVDLRGGDVTLDVELVPVNTELGEVRVTGENALRRSDRAVEVLDGEDLEAARGQTLGETLESINGVTSLTTGPTISKPVVRGLHSDRVLILQDGVEQEGQAWGGEHAPEIDPFSADRVEVIKGAAGVEYGAGAIGGVIRLDDAPLPTEPGLSGRVSLQAFTNNLQAAASAELEDAPAALPGVSWRLHGSLRRAGDARSPDFVIRNSAFAEASGHLTLGYARGPVELEGHLRRYRSTLGIYRGSHFGNARNLQAIIERGGPDPAWNYGFSYAIDAPKQEVTHDVASLHAHVEPGGGHAFDATVSVQRNVRQEFDAHRRFSDPPPADTPAFELALISQALDAKWTPPPTEQFTLTAGVNAQTQLNENGASGYLVPNFRSYDGGAYVHGATLLSPRLTLDAGLRADARTMTAYPYDRSARVFETVQRSYVGGAAALGAIWSLSDTWSLSGNLGSAWRAPNISELFSEGVHHGTAQYEIGDRDLGVERSLDVSTTLRHESDRAAMEVNAYLNHVFGYVYGLERPEPTVTIRGTFPTFLTVQDNARFAGVDASATIQVGPRVLLGARTSLLWADNLSRGGPLYSVPSHRIGGSLRFDAPPTWPGTLSLTTDVQHVTEQMRVQPGAFLAAPYPPAYTLVGLQLGGTTEVLGRPVRVSLRIDNLFDVRYRDALSRFRYFVDEPGRSGSLRIGFPIG
ncbi:MAG: TonB-dependent receptor [Rubricoccaceae bacterium]